MVTPASSNRRRADAGEERAQAPIRWPHPSGASVALVGLWVAGLALALFVPAAIVSPMAVTAPAGRVWTAFTITIVGSLVMVAAATLLWRRTRDAAFFIMGAVPAFATIAGGSIFAASKLTGT